MGAHREIASEFRDNLYPCSDIETGDNGIRRQINIVRRVNVIVHINVKMGSEGRKNAYGTDITDGAFKTYGTPKH
jgi:hypothetical protein